ncbi:hypothetical protein VTO42DRAFT_4223 [Malbranchea cinnamomea]
MPPRLHLFSRYVSQPLRYEASRQGRAAMAAAVHSSRSMVTAAAAATSSSPSSTYTSPPPMFPPSQPPSHRRPEFRKSQLHRQYTSMLRTMPLILLFQHNNLRSTEWASIRRELALALRKVDQENAAAGRTDVPPLADVIKLQIVQTHIFEAAVRVVDYFRPEQLLQQQEIPDSVDSASPIVSRDDPRLTHDLSRTAYQAVRHMRKRHDLSTLLVGPIAILAFPSVSPQHLKAALSILAPQPPDFPPPTRRANPGYHEFATQAGLQKLMLLGARVEGKVFDDEGTRWVGKIEGGLSGLRAQLVAMLQGVGASLTSTLEAAGKSLYLTMESRRSAMEEEQKEKEGKGDSS